MLVAYGLPTIFTEFLPAPLAYEPHPSSFHGFVTRMSSLQKYHPRFAVIHAPVLLRSESPLEEIRCFESPMKPLATANA